MYPDSFSCSKSCLKGNFSSGLKCTVHKIFYQCQVSIEKTKLYINYNVTYCHLGRCTIIVLNNVDRIKRTSKFDTPTPGPASVSSRIWGQVMGIGVLSSRVRKAWHDCITGWQHVFHTFFPERDDIEVVASSTASITRDTCLTMSVPSAMSAADRLSISVYQY